MRAFSLLLVCVAGCGSAASGKPLHEFPTRDALAQIAGQQGTRAPLGTDLAGTESWTLELPARAAEHPGHPLLSRVTPRAKPAAGLDCVAHELARIVITASGKRPGMSLRRFVSARCGALVIAPAFRTWTTQAVTAEDDGAIYARLTQQAEPIDDSVQQAGVGLARNGADVLIVVAYGNPEVEVEPFEQVVGDAGMLQIRGRVLHEIDGLQAFVNSGERGVAPCELDPGQAAPAFALQCPLAPGDDAAWVQLLALPRGRVIGHEVLGLIALRRSDAATTYSPGRVGDARPVADTASFRAAVLDLLNSVRRDAGLSVLVASQPQSEMASSVTPAFFNAALTQSTAAQATIDAITLGLLAGWDVRGGMIRKGDLTASLVVESLDAERWLADALERPLGRAVLLDREARVLALGSALQQKPDVLAAIAVTYAFFEDEASPGERAMQLLERLGRVRQARGLGRTVLVSDTPGVEAQLASIRRNEASPEEALNALMQEVSQSMRVPVQGFVWETHDLERIEFPRELLQRGDLTLGAGVTYYRAKGGAWGQYAVLFVVINPGQEV